MLNNHFKAKKVTSNGEILSFDVKSNVAEKLKSHCEKIGLKLTELTPGE